MKTIIRKRDMHADIVDFFYKNLGNVNEMTIKPLKIVI